MGRDPKDYVEYNGARHYIPPLVHVNEDRWSEIKEDPERLEAAQTVAKAVLKFAEEAGKRPRRQARFFPTLLSRIPVRMHFQSPCPTRD